jgi:Ni,Fe-hydrogenase I large subunit
MVHRGQIIKDYIEDLGIKKEILAERLIFKGKKRTVRTLFSKLKEPNMSLDDVLAFQKALNYDFSDKIPELKKINTYNIQEVSEPIEHYGKIISDYQAKYYKLLEEQNELLRKGQGNFNQLAEAIITLSKSINTGIGDISGNINSGSKELNESILLIAKMLDNGHTSTAS